MIPVAGSWFKFEGKLVQVQSATSQAVRFMFWETSRVRTVGYEQWIPAAVACPYGK